VRFPIRYIELPAAPRTGSPIPGLTSIHAARQRGPYGDARYRGNCGGYLMRDLLQYYQPRRVLDPMTGSGTCRETSAENWRFPASRWISSRSGCVRSGELCRH
jgi:hypothetical protein